MIVLAAKTQWKEQQHCKQIIQKWKHCSKAILNPYVVAA